MSLRLDSMIMELRPIHPIPLPWTPTEGAIMVGFIFILLISAALIYVVARRADLEQRGQARWGGEARSPWEEPTSRFAPLRERKKAAKPAAPVFDHSKLLENSSCEVCSVAPKVQFRNSATGSTLEFCGHHATRQERALREKGFTVTVDGR